MVGLGRLLCVRRKDDLSAAGAALELDGDRDRGKGGRLAIIDIDFRKIERLQKALKSAPGIITKELRKAVCDLVLLVCRRSAT